MMEGFVMKETMKEMFSLDSKVAIVTGGNGGIGKGIARGLAGAGANIVIGARNEAKTANAVAGSQGAPLLHFRPNRWISGWRRAWR